MMENADKFKGDTSVYVLLPDELVEVYRPVAASRLGNGAFQLDELANYDPKIERWEFPPGSKVVCELRKLSDGEVLVATSLMVN